MRQALFVLALAALMSGASVVYAQQQASVTGPVTDDSGGVLPGVTVTATETSTGVTRLAVSDERGIFRFPNLPPGTYSVQAELPGFSTILVTDLELLVGQNATIPFVLGVAALQESVTVTSEAPLVDIMSSEVAGNIDRRQMEELPLQGRNWQELSLLVKGVTANNVGDRPGVDRDDQFQLNLDGQQITQRVAGSGFGQPKISREAIAEFQIVTNMFDITQGRSTGMQVQAISRSGTNQFHSSFYGYFRNDRFNSADPISDQVLPFSNQQVGGTVGGPIVQNKTHFFFSYEYEREPSTVFLQPTRLPNQEFQFPKKETNKNLLTRVDHQASGRDSLSMRAQRWDFYNPFRLSSGTSHPSRAQVRASYATNVFGQWTRVVNDNFVMEIRGGYNGYSWQNQANPAMDINFTPEIRFPGLTIGGTRNYPNLTWANTVSTRFDGYYNRGSHEIKIGAEFLRVKDTKNWSLNKRGTLRFRSRPDDLERRIPEAAWDDPTQWDFSGLDPIVQRFDQNYHPTYEVYVPRPTLAVWFGDNWRASDNLTINLGLRWDVDPRATNPPRVNETVILIDNGVQSGDFGYKTGIRDINSVAPRVGFAYNVGGGGDLVIRGGTGLYYNAPVSNVTYSHQFFNGAIAASFSNDGLPGFIADPSRGVTPEQFLSGEVPTPVQAARIISPDFKMPYTWQSSIGFQKQIGPVMAFEADLTHWNWYNDTRTKDVNLFFDPVNGYNQDPADVGRPNLNYNQISWFESSGKQDYMALSMGLTRRFQDNFQGGATYTAVLYQHDDGSIGYTDGNSNNPFDPVDGEWARSTAFQRNTVRLHGTFQLPYDITTSIIYAFGSGNYYATTVADEPFNKPGVNRLNVGDPIVIPQAARDRFDGPDIIDTGGVVPRNALKGFPLHKVDLRVSKIIRLGAVRVTAMAEVFNLFNHDNFGNYVGQVDSSSFGQQRATDGNAYVPRTGQLGFRIEF